MTSPAGRSEPAISLPEDGELSPEICKTLQLLPPFNIFRMVARAPASFRPFLDLALSILVKSELDARKREIAVLRVAHLTRSKYEWTQHLAIARGVGVIDEEIEKIAVDGPVTGLDEEGNLLCRVAEEVTREVRLGDEALTAIISRYGERQAAELILCCAYFNMLSRFLESTRVPLEESPILEAR